MNTEKSKPASLWLRISLLIVLVLGITVGYEAVSTSGRRIFPSISLSGNKSFKLRISGPTGLKFCGTISLKTADGRTASRDIDGVAPETFELFGKSVSVDLRKCEETGYLKVAIASNGQPAMQGITTVQYGAVNIGAN